MSRSIQKTSRTENVLSNSRATLIYRMVLIFSNFAVRTVFIRNLGVQYTGVTSVFTDIMSVLSLAELGFGEAVSYALYNPLANNDKIRIQELLNFFRVVYRWIALIVIAGGALCLPILPRLLKDVSDINENIYLIFALYVLKSSMSYLLVYRATFLIATQNSRVVSKIDTVQIIAKMGLQIALLVCFKSFYGYLFTELIFTLGRNLYVSHVTKNMYTEIDFTQKYKINFSKEKQIINNVVAMAMYKISSVILHGTDSIIISSFVNTATAGILSSFRLIPNSLQLAYEQVLLSITPSLGNLLAEEEVSNRSYKVFKKLFFISFWIASFCVVSMYVLLNPFANIIWFEKKQLLSNFTISCIVANSYLACLTVPFQSFRTSAGLFVYGKYRPVIMAILNIIISLALVKPLGVNGVLLGTILSRLLTQTWYDPYLVFKRVFVKPVKDFYLYFVGLTCLTIFNCFLTQTVAEIISVGNRYLDFLTAALCCAIIPNLVIAMIFHKTEEFHYFIELSKNILKKYCSRTRRG